METKIFKRILVTGGSALVGTALKSIREDYPGIDFVFSNSKDCDLTDKDKTFRYVREMQVDAIIHLAAISGGIGLSMKFPATLLRDNILINLNILEAARIYRVKKTIMTLSSGMYPINVPNPIREEYIDDGPAHPSNYSYSFAKRLIAPAIKAYRTQYSLDVIGLVPNGIFGENDNFNGDEAAMLPALVRRFYESRHGTSKLQVWGDGSPLREYTYSKDIARAFMWCLYHYDDDQILNIGSREEYSIKEIAFMVADILKIDRSRIEFDLSKPQGIYRKSTDNSKFVKLSNFQYTPFREGLVKMIGWFCHVYENSPELLRVSSKIKLQ